MTRVCAVTGHREIAEDKRRYVEYALFREAVTALSKGYTHFISGFSDGVDLEFARIIVLAKEILLPNLKAELPPVTLEAALPYRDRLKTENPMFHELLEKCDIITYTGEEYHRGCFHVRNSYMVDKCDRLIAVFDGRSESGTAQTIKLAEKQNREIALIYISSDEAMRV